MLIRTAPGKSLQLKEKQKRFTRVNIPKVVSGNLICKEKHEMFKI